ncbi:MBL fold metallo-hydrolase [Marinitenerispora sediminis]|uniref:MBL fold metallo-hydrolase n=1 Tax=Marinitenerispora sediminis TaxID=1931232 RepID=A0A368T5C2_9ACTN|nr:MBL fold metallo-hydrolase [Marinitenerispora sediminis]RCV50008.1 MBL fold metallo-hydrolase [Marinitenerispora sediminis]RCV54068.1 MBL fold metallo-hydrolase [Marinitenerispora sediminis]RCV58553.1 MBL fold metallo-hydrolase [Marinitenerispora sediminis]
MRQDGITEVAAGVHLVHGGSTNWVILTDGDAVTLVDTGYPGDREPLTASLAAVGRRPEDVAAVLVTHAHTDHIGSARLFGADHGVPVLMHEAEVPNARWESRTQVTFGEVLRNGWRPGVLPWAVHAARSGGLADARVPMARPFPTTSGPLDLPGRPVPVHTPGHTPGHCAYHLPHLGVLVTGDALVTGHPTSAVRGPQLLPRMFDGDRAGALASLDVLERVEADVLLPGHGPVHRGTAREAAARARERAS